MSGNYTEHQIVATGDLVAGALVKLSATVNAFTLVDVATDDQYTAISKAEKVRVEQAAVAFTVGAPVYWVNANNNVSTAGDVLLGFAHSASEAGDTHMDLVFDGYAEYLKA